MIEEEGRGATVWDWLVLADGRTALITLDVRADGLPPPVHLAAARGVLRAVAAHGGGLDGILHRMNAAMAASALADVDQYVECGMIAAHAGGAWNGRAPAACLAA